MKYTGYFLTSISESSDYKEESELCRYLYDSFSHNEMTGEDVILRIMKETETDINDTDECEEQIYDVVYHDETFILSYDKASGDFLVYKTFKY